MIGELVVVDVHGVIWWARPDVENADELLPSGEVAWAWGSIGPEGLEIQGDWLDAIDALAAVADVLLQDQRDADEYYERRFYGD